MSAYVWQNDFSEIAKQTDKEDKVSNLCRIYVDNDIKKSILLDEMSLPIENENGITDNKFNIKNTAGIDYPLVCINNNFLFSEEILFMEIKSNDLIPYITLHISPKSNSLINQEVIKDGDIISIFIRTTSDVITPLRSDFIINSCKIHGYNINTQGNSPIIILKGELFIPGIHSSNENLYYIGNSKNALKEVAKKLGIGFAFNDENETNDNQLWFSSKEKITKYITNIASHIWQDEQSFFKVWIDLYYNLNFINVNKCLISEDDIDLTIATLTNSMQNISPIDSSEDNNIGEIKLLTNIESKKMSPFYILDIKTKNNSTSITSNIGSNIINQMFIHNQNFFNQGEEPYIELKNIQMYDPNKKEDCIILRGRNKFDSSSALKGDMQYQNINTDDINTHAEWRGIQYTISDEDKKNKDSNSWSGNVNINYNRAETHNLINNKELDKMYIEVTVRGACLQIMRGEKIPILIQYKDSLDSVINNNEKMKGINKLYSGYYFVDDIKITYSYKDKKSLSSNFYTTFTLKRREWPVPIDYEKDNK